MADLWRWLVGCFWEAKVMHWTLARMDLPRSPQVEALLKHYLVRPDPLAWLAVADYLTELQGDGDAYVRAIAICRRRGQWHGPLRQGWHVASAQPRRAPWVEVTLGRWKVVFGMMRHWIRVRWSLTDEPAHCRREYHLAYAALDVSYQTRRILEMIDGIGLLEEGDPAGFEGSASALPGGVK